MSNRSRSPTPQYSDSFESVESPKKSKLLKRKAVTKPLQANGRGAPVTIRTHPYLSHLKRNSSRNVNLNISDRLYTHTPDHLDESVKRLLSTRSHKINELSSLVETLKKKIEALQTEVKTLKIQSYRQEKALVKIDHAQTEIPTILNHQDAELKMLREQVRRLKEELATESEKRREAESKNVKYKQHLVKLKELTEDKSLPERDDLLRTVNNLKNEVSEKDKRIVDLQKYIENLQKNYKHERSQDAERYKNVLQSRQAMAHQYSRVQELLREKEKQMELHNIYSQRIRLRGMTDNSSIVSLNNSESLSSHRRDASPHTLSSGRPLDRISSNGLQGRKLNKVNSQRSHSMKARKTTSADIKDVEVASFDSEGVSAMSDHKKVDKEIEIDDPIYEVDEVVSFGGKDRIDMEDRQTFQAEAEEAKVRLRHEHQEAERLAREKQLIENLETEKAERRRREEIERKEREQLEDKRIREEFAEKERRQKQQREEEERRLELEKEKLREAAEERKRKDELLKLLAAVDNNVEEAERERQEGISSTVDNKKNGRQSKEYLFSNNVENLHLGRPTVDESGEKQSRMSLDKGALPPIRDSSLIRTHSITPVHDRFDDPHLPSSIPFFDENRNSPFTDQELSFSHSNDQNFSTNLLTEEVNPKQKLSSKSSRFVTQHSDDIEEMVL